ncbi:MAG: hypothetical protein RL335_599 [Bacteroidota bacterium]|jgi:hypothetical protein
MQSIKKTNDLQGEHQGGRNKNVLKCGLLYHFTDDMSDGGTWHLDI